MPTSLTTPRSNDEPTEEEITRVYMWWEKRRDRWAEKMECEKATIPAGVPWFLDPDFEPSLEDIAAGIKVAMKYGLLNE